MGGAGKSSVGDITDVDAREGPGVASESLAVEAGNGTALLEAFCLKGEEIGDIASLKVDKLKAVFRTCFPAGTSQ